MSYGRPTDSQIREISKAIQGKHVHDLGAGDLYLSRKLLDWGASKITAIDSASDVPVQNVQNLIDRIHVIQKHFDDIPGTNINTAFVSWPSNYVNGILRLLKKASTIIYLGCNVNGTVCGTTELFEYLINREVLTHLPHTRNTLIIYGPGMVKRAPFYEEDAALNMSNGSPWSWPPKSGGPNTRRIVTNMKTGQFG